MEFQAMKTWLCETLGWHGPRWFAQMHRFGIFPAYHTVPLMDVHQNDNIFIWSSKTPKIMDKSGWMSGWSSNVACLFIDFDIQLFTWSWFMFFLIPETRKSTSPEQRAPETGTSFPAMQSLRDGLHRRGTAPKELLVEEVKMLGCVCCVGCFFFFFCCVFVVVTVTDRKFIIFLTQKIFRKKTVDTTKSNKSHAPQQISGIPSATSSQCGQRETGQRERMETWRNEIWENRKLNVNHHRNMYMYDTCYSDYSINFSWFLNFMFFYSCIVYITLCFVTWYHMIAYYVFISHLSLIIWQYIILYYIILYYIILYYIIV